MSQSYANTNNLPMELGLGSPREWVWPEYSRFLRYPEAGQGFGYRIMRLAVIAVLRVRALYQTQA